MSQWHVLVVRTLLSAALTERGQLLPRCAEDHKAECSANYPVYKSYGALNRILGKSYSVGVRPSVDYSYDVPPVRMSDLTNAKGRLVTSPYMLVQRTPRLWMVMMRWDVLHASGSKHLLRSPAERSKLVYPQLSFALLRRILASSRALRDQPW